MSQQGRDDKGRYTQKVPLDEVRQCFRSSEPHTAAEIADELDISTRTALNKLEQLHEAGELKRKKVGARAVVWYRELNPRLAAQVLADATGRPTEAFELPEETSMPALDELEHERIDES